jgi:hypothetical protein
MTVIAFAPKSLQQDGVWQTSELDTMRSTFAPAFASGEASGWGAGATEVGDPQFYLLGPSPEECVLCVSRLGRLYVLEDGAGHVLYEHARLDLLVQRAKSFLSRKKASLIARAALLWAAAREVFEEKLEPILAEGEELLIHVAPQLAAIA